MYIYEHITQDDIHKPIDDHILEVSSKYGIILNKYKIIGIARITIR